jgi:hypothetical protein
MTMIVEAGAEAEGGVARRIASATRCCSIEDMVFAALGVFVFAGMFYPG